MARERKGKEKKGDEEGDTKTKGKGKKKFSKMFIVSIICLVVAVLVILIMWGMTPQDYLGVADVMGDNNEYLGNEVEVKGTVDSTDNGTDTFLLKDGGEEMLVHYPKALPSNFEIGKEVVVKGTLEETNEYQGHPTVFRATSVTVGCASKYE